MLEDTEDIPSYPMLDNHWDVALEYIQDSIIDNDGACVIHCFAGHDRLALTTCAYYMVHTRTPLLQAVQHCHVVSPFLTNSGFQGQLVALARYENLLT
jgi:protein-tyrosine phosphatase